MKLEHRNNCVLIKYVPDRGEAFGSFDEEMGKIYVSSRLGLLERECIYLHELSHKECFSKKCKCWKSNYWCEYHAMRGELQKIAMRNNSQLTKAFLKSVKRSLSKYRTNRKIWKFHLAALTRLMKTKAFKELENC